MTNPKLDELKRQIELLNAQERRELVLMLGSGEAARFAASPTDLNRFAGIVKFPLDALEYQQSIRAEWDR